MQKLFRTNQNIGRVKYLVSFHNGENFHQDGSRFFDVRTFKNKVAFNKFQKDLQKDGYAYEN